MPSTRKKQDSPATDVDRLIEALRPLRPEQLYVLRDWIKRRAISKADAGRIDEHNEAVIRRAYEDRKRHSLTAEEALNRHADEHIGGEFDSKSLRRRFSDLTRKTAARSSSRPRVPQLDRDNLAAGLLAKREYEKSLEVLRDWLGSKTLRTDPLPSNAKVQVNLKTLDPQSLGRELFRMAREVEKAAEADAAYKDIEDRMNETEDIEGAYQELLSRREAIQESNLTRDAQEEGLLDLLGRPVPDHLQPIFRDRILRECRDDIRSLAKDIRWICAQLRPKATEGPEELCNAIKNLQGAEEKFSAVCGMLEGSQPHAVCPGCDGKGCNGCRKTGYLSRTEYDKHIQSRKP